jgi:hypothetical protein
MNTSPTADADVAMVFGVIATEDDTVAGVGEVTRPIVGAVA